MTLIYYFLVYNFIVFFTTSSQLYFSQIKSAACFFIFITSSGWSQASCNFSRKSSTSDFLKINALSSTTSAHSGMSDTRQQLRRLVLVPPHSVFCSISFRCGGLSIERNQKPLTPENTLAITHHNKQKQVEVKRSSRVNPHEIRTISGCPYAVVK